MVRQKENISLDRLGIVNINIIRKIQKECDETIWSKESLTHLFREGSGLGFILFNELLPAGYIMLRSLSREAEVLSFGVIPLFRRKGFGMILIQEAERFIISNKKSQLMLEVSINNFTALSFYSSAGFKEIKILKNYYKTDKGRQDGLLLSKSYI